MFESCLRNYKMDDKPTRLSSIFLYPLTHHYVSTVPSYCINSPAQRIFPVGGGNVGV